MHHRMLGCVPLVVSPRRSLVAVFPVVRPLGIYRTRETSERMVKSLARILVRIHTFLAVARLFPERVW